MGYLPALCSVLLVSFAQLAMKYAMSSLPSGLGISETGLFFLQHLSATGFLFAGLAGYALSMGCWYLPLKYLPLSKAYALLSLSYIVVWALALALGLQGDEFSLKTLTGILLVIAGVTLVCLPATAKK